MEEKRAGKGRNAVFWIIISVLVLFTLYNIYSRYKGKAQLQLMEPQTTDERTGSTQPGTQTDMQQEAKTGVGNENTQEETTAETKKVTAPDFTLTDLDGNEVKLSEYRGKIVFLNFWAVWCPHCVNEMPEFDTVNKEFTKGEDAVILTVNEQDTAETAKEFMKSKKLSLPVLLDEDGEVGYMYGVEGIPVTFVIDREGSVYGRITGTTDGETLRKVLDDIK